VDWDIPKMEHVETSSAVKQGISLLNSLDPAIHAPLQERRLEGLAKYARLQWPIQISEILTHKRMKRDELKAWSQLKPKGRVPSFTEDRNGKA